MLGPVQLPSPAGVWARVVLGVALGVGLIQWPYADACGAGLALKVAAIGILVAAGVWAAARSWRRRMGFAHVVALLVIAWGVGLFANEVIARSYYGFNTAAWRCPSAW